MDWGVDGETKDCMGSSTYSVFLFGFNQAAMALLGVRFLFMRLNSTHYIWGLLWLQATTGSVSRPIAAFACRTNLVVSGGKSCCLKAHECGLSQTTSGCQEWTAGLARVCRAFCRETRIE
jgi:hypothetical protein